MRSSLVPDVPAMSELPALRNMVFTVWFGLFAPVGVDKAIAASVHTHIAAIFGTEAIRQRTADLGMQPTVLDQAAFARFLVDERGRFKSLVSERNIKAE
jgi:tripartite-type tricarboxylate transporter receptor subunit TctC